MTKQNGAYSQRSSSSDIPSKRRSYASAAGMLSSQNSPSPSHISVTPRNGVRFRDEPCDLTLPSAPALRGVQADFIVGIGQKSVVRVVERVKVLSVFRLDWGDKLFPINETCRASSAYHSAGQNPKRQHIRRLPLTSRPGAPEKVNLLAAEEEDAPEDQGLHLVRMCLGIGQGEGGSPRMSGGATPNSPRSAENHPLVNADVLAESLNIGDCGECL